MYRPGSVGESGYGGAYGGYGDEFASAFSGLALGGEQPPGSPAFGSYAQPAAQPSPMSPRAAGQEAFNDASAHAESMFAEQDVHWLRAAYGQAFDPERLLAGEAVLPDHGRAPSSPGYHRRVRPSAGASLKPPQRLGPRGACAAHGTARGGIGIAAGARAARCRPRWLRRRFCFRRLALGCAVASSHAAASPARRPLTSPRRAACTRLSSAGRTKRPAPAATAISVRYAACPRPRMSSGIAAPRASGGRGTAPGLLAASAPRSRVARGRLRSPAPRSVGRSPCLAPGLPSEAHVTPPRPQFAHGQDELRPVMRHPRYKTEVRFFRRCLGRVKRQYRRRASRRC